MCKASTSLWGKWATGPVLSSGAIAEVSERQNIEQNAPKFSLRELSLFEKFKPKDILKNSGDTGRKQLGRG